MTMLSFTLHRDQGHRKMPKSFHIRSHVDTPTEPLQINFLEMILHQYLGIMSVASIFCFADFCRVAGDWRQQVDYVYWLFCLQVVGSDIWLRWATTVCPKALGFFLRDCCKSSNYCYFVHQAWEESKNPKINKSCQTNHTAITLWAYSYSKVYTVCVTNF